MKHLNKVLYELLDQAQWIAEHGGNKKGYVKRYGDYGNGGEAIFEADYNEFLKRKEKFDAYFDFMEDK